MNYTVYACLFNFDKMRRAGTKPETPVALAPVTRTSPAPLPLR